MIAAFFPKNASAARLARDAERHAVELDIERGIFSDCDERPTERLVVNYLRHQYTDYDEEQTVERHREACEMIADRFSWLAEECQRQVKRRAAAEREREGEYQQWLYEQEQEKVKRRARVEESKKAIADLSVRQKVTFEDRGNTYEAEITKIGRSKVTISYEIRTGKDRARSRTVHAALVTPIEASA